jgi:hypothetical protein
MYMDWQMQPVKMVSSWIQLGITSYMHAIHLSGVFGSNVRGRETRYLIDHLVYTLYNTILWEGNSLKHSVHHFPPINLLVYFGTSMAIMMAHTTFFY